MNGKTIACLSGFILIIWGAISESWIRGILGLIVLFIGGLAD